jgi:hypothetical protein
VTRRQTSSWVDRALGTAAPQRSGEPSVLEAEPSVLEAFKEAT